MCTPNTNPLHNVEDLDAKYIAGVRQLAILGFQVQIEKDEREIAAARDELKKLREADGEVSKLQEDYNTLNSTYEKKEEEWKTLTQSFERRLAEAERMRSAPIMFEARKIELDAAKAKTKLFEIGLQLLEVEAVIGGKDSDESRHTLEDSIHNMERELIVKKHGLTRMSGYEHIAEHAAKEITLEQSDQVRKQLEEALAKNAVLQEQCDRMVPLYEIGHRIRSRKFELDLALSTERLANKDIVKQGNAAAHRGSALADATLFLNRSPLEARGDNDREFLERYGFQAKLVWKYAAFTKFHDILNWSVDMKVFRQAGVSVERFVALENQLLSLIGTGYDGPLVIENNEVFGSNAHAVQLYGLLKGERDAGLQVYNEYRANREL